MIEKEAESDRVIALAGNPNVGKSTVFNALTGMNQHTGNWPGKTVASAQGRHVYKDMGYILVDLPGTYSLMAHSAEEGGCAQFYLFRRCGRSDCRMRRHLPGTKSEFGFANTRDYPACCRLCEPDG